MVCSIKNNGINDLKHYEYQAPHVFVGIFYLLLAAWVVFCIIFVEKIVSETLYSKLFGLFMIAFIIFYTCYFALSLAYKVELWEDGRIRLTSLRRTLESNIEIIPHVEGPHLPIGFIRFRLEREKGHLFALTGDVSLHKLLSVVKAMNSDIVFKNLKLNR